MEVNELLLLDYYEKNKNKPWDTWIKVDEIFPRPGKQGLVGLMSGLGKYSHLKYVFKISQYINYLAQHELTVMSSLNDISNYCPHFCKSIGSIICPIDPLKRRKGNPFELESKYSIEKEVLLLEHLKNSYKLYNIINTDSPRITEDILFSAVKQTLAAIIIGQRKKNFTHYDLHSNNIMMKKCDKDLVILYILDESNQFCIPTRGYYPIIIDYGFSYSNALDGGPMWPTLNHTDVGFMSDRFDKIADPKLFLVTVSDEIHEAKKSEKSRILKNITKNIYSRLDIDWESGWDTRKSCATDYVISVLNQGDKDKDKQMDSSLFKEYDYYCMDLLNALIVLPLEPQDYSDIQRPYKTFIKEFSKIEDEITTPFFCLYILKGIVDAAITVRKDYQHNDTRDQAVAYFRLAVIEKIDSVAKFVKITAIHFEKMLCSLLCLGKALEGAYYDIMHKITCKKEKEYTKVYLQTPEEVLAAIEINIPDNKYSFSNNTKIMVVDCIKETYYTTTLQQYEDIENINNFESISRGPELYNILMSREKACKKKSKSNTVSARSTQSTRSSQSPPSTKVSPVIKKMVENMVEEINEDMNSVEHSVEDSVEHSIEDNIMEDLGNLSED